MDDKTKNINLPDARGHFGKFGGKYVIETLMPALESLEKLYNDLFLLENDILINYTFRCIKQ